MLYNFLLNHLVLFVDYAYNDNLDNPTFFYVSIQLINIVNTQYDHSLNYEESFIVNRINNSTLGIPFQKLIIKYV
jgi:hypothetical protein